MIPPEALKRLREDMEAALDRERFTHTLGVEAEILWLGNHFPGTDPDRLRVAALLHDLTRPQSASEQRRLCRHLQIPLTPADLASPAVLHAKTAAKLSARQYPLLVDDEIAGAIAKHTTGDPEMSLFDQLLFIADYTEPGREHPACRQVRAYLHQALPGAQAHEREAILTQAVADALCHTRDYLLSQGLPIAPQSIAAIEALR
ncbi:MAG: bis(5'-nucleosyl)-tetraphosphatase (symmetrical) YqeK [Eubacteriales bacterium]